MSWDLATSIALLGSLAGAAALYALRVFTRGATRHARVEKAGTSPLLGRSSMEAAYWVFEPLATALAKGGVPANAITGASLVLGLGAAIALGLGYFGLAALLIAIASLCDALDGLVAAKAGTTSKAGEVFDSSADRYVEFFLLGGLAVHLRASAAALALMLLALLGSFMVSYSTAKAEALRITPPRGAMRRAERAVLLFAGVALTPLATALSGARGWGGLAAMSPIFASVGLIAVVANVSAVRRLRVIARAAVEQDRGAGAATATRAQARTSAEAPPAAARLERVR